MAGWHEQDPDWWKPKAHETAGWHEDDVYGDPDRWRNNRKPKSPVKIPFFAHFYAWMFVVTWTLWPIVFIVVWRGEVWPWLVTGGWVAVTQASFWFALRRCSGEKLSFWDGLLIVSTSAMTNWTYTDVLVVLPTLLYAFLASIVFALSADSPEHFHNFVFGMYQRRMRQ